ncbi:hypothetical protein [Calditerrivibrio sp.]|uniref:Uncharacterized protein n=1 Tax=Calditerrivibrio nitroreducens TaxID=477976 RepID=A0A2J6WM34_9BACT|nr:MAG: hypothetical protein C0187_04140 [Calditerrivibrio nitroreducens]
MIGLLILIFGGGDLFAAQRGKYSVLAEKVDTGIKTEFIVFSKSDTDAREEVNLNGWKVLKVTKLSKDSTDNNPVISSEYTDKTEKISNSEKKDSSAKKITNLKNYNKKKGSNVSKIKTSSLKKTTKSSSENKYCNQVNVYINSNQSLSDSGKIDSLGLKTVFAEKLNIPENSIKIDIRKVKR